MSDNIFSLVSEGCVSGGEHPTVLPGLCGANSNHTAGRLLDFTAVLVEGKYAAQSGSSRTVPSTAVSV